MDEIDRKALFYLMSNGRATWAELGSFLGFSAPAAADRAHKLQERGVIKSYAALVDPQSVGLDLTALVFVTLERPSHRQAFLAKVKALSEVQECHHVTGDDDYFLKVRCANTADLDRLLTEEIKGVSGVARTRTIIALSTEKEGPEISLRNCEFRQRG